MSGQDLGVETQHFNFTVKYYTAHEHTHNDKQMWTQFYCKLNLVGSKQMYVIVVKTTALHNYVIVPKVERLKMFESFFSPFVRVTRKGYKRRFRRRLYYATNM